MNDREALDLLRPAVPGGVGGRWADLGAGTGVLTRALATLLGAEGEVIAVDADAGALRAVRAPAGGAAVRTVHADFTRPLDLPPLDGVLMANALHFVADADAVLRRVVGSLHPGGRFVLVEYEGRRPGPWVPHPVSIARFESLAAAAGLTPPRVVATRPSAYGGSLYVAVAGRG
ncbi:MAG TPA: class I SAM-dependent methyltransferase [Longimicrobium sp.]|nr:class I SAM-dependent methyltransferase [Longimicrobium sp.]